MKLYNRTKCPDNILRALLVRAARRICARSARVVVVIGQRRVGWSARGMCYRGTLVRCPGVAGGRWLCSDGGMLTLNLPHLYAGCDPLTAAADVWHVALHEWAHIRDYQQIEGGARLSWSKRTNGRRPKWEERPEEMRANDAREQAMAEDDGGDAVLDYALWYEEAQHP